MHASSPSKQRGVNHSALASKAAIGLKASSDPSFDWAAKPETATKKLRNLLGLRAQFEEFRESKDCFRDFSPRRKNHGAVEGAPSVLSSREKLRQEGTSVFFQF